jgi:hypothetical protein
MLPNSTVELSKVQEALLEVLNGMAVAPAAKSTSAKLIGATDQFVQLTVKIEPLNALHAYSMTRLRVETLEMQPPVDQLS